MSSSTLSRLLTIGVLLLMSISAHAIARQDWLFEYAMDLFQKRAPRAEEMLRQYLIAYPGVGPEGLQREARMRFRLSLIVDSRTRSAERDSALTAIRSIADADARNLVLEEICATALAAGDTLFTRHVRADPMLGASPFMARLRFEEAVDAFDRGDSAVARAAITGMSEPPPGADGFIFAYLKGKLAWDAGDTLAAYKAMRNDIPTGHRVAKSYTEIRAWSSYAARDYDAALRGFERWETEFGETRTEELSRATLIALLELNQNDEAFFRAVQLCRQNGAAYAHDAAREALPKINVTREQAQVMTAGIALNVGGAEAHPLAEGFITRAAELDRFLSARLVWVSYVDSLDSAALDEALARMLPRFVDLHRSDALDAVASLRPALADPEQESLLLAGIENLWPDDRFLDRAFPYVARGDAPPSEARRMMGILLDRLARNETLRSPDRLALVISLIGSDAARCPDGAVRWLTGIALDRADSALAASIAALSDPSAAAERDSAARERLFRISADQDSAALYRLSGLLMSLGSTDAFRAEMAKAEFLFAYREGRYMDALEIHERSRAIFTGGGNAQDAQRLEFAAAECARLVKKTERALVGYADVIALDSSDTIALISKLRSVDLWYGSEAAPPKADSWLVEVLDDPRLRGDDRAAATYLKGVAAASRGDESTAIESWREVVRAWPESRWAELSQRMVRLSEDEGGN